MSSILFAAAHASNDGETMVGLAGVLLVGLVFCLLLRASGSLWLGIGLHAAWDWAQSYLYGTPDSGSMMEGHLLVTQAMGDPRWSGGTAGPEGSVLAIPVSVLGALALVWALRRAGLLPDRSPSSSR